MANAAYYYTDYLQKFRNNNGFISYSYVSKVPTTVNDFEKKEKPILVLQINGRLLPSEEDYIIDLAFPNDGDVPAFLLDPEWLNGFVSVKRQTRVARYGVKRLYNEDSKILSFFLLKNKFCSLSGIQGKESTIENSVPFSMDISIKDCSCLCQAVPPGPKPACYCTNYGNCCGGGRCSFNLGLNKCYLNCDNNCGTKENCIRFNASICNKRDNGGIVECGK
jgi:hypothetical protein